MATRQIADGRQVVTTAGTRVQLSATNNTKVGGIIITAETDNTGAVVVGASTVVAAVATRRGTPLAAGKSMTINGSWAGDEGRVDLSDIYIDAEQDGDGVTFMYLQ